MAAVRERITKGVVERLAAPESGSAFVWDSEVPGFAVRVHRTAEGRVWRAYVFRWWVPDPKKKKGGSDRWITIGEHGAPWKPDPKTDRPRALTAELAREEALRFRGMWRAGGDPRAARTKDRVGVVAPVRPDCPTLEAFGLRYLDKHSELHKAYRTAKEERGNFTRHLVPWRGAVRLDDITSADVADLQAGLRLTPVTANRCLSLLSHMFTMARKWAVLPRSHENPCADVTRFKEGERERYLSADELARLGPALVDARNANPYEVAAILVLAFTGARPTEILTLERERLRLDLGHVMVQRKGRWLPIYLPPPAITILQALPEKPLNPYVFPAAKSNGPLTNVGPLRKVWRRVRDAAGLADVRLYDLRHTLASMAVNTGTSLPIIGGLLGHTSAKTTQRYAHLAALPVRTAGKRVAKKIDAALGRRRRT